MSVFERASDSHTLAILIDEHSLVDSSTTDNGTESEVLVLCIATARTRNVFSAIQGLAERCAGRLQHLDVAHDLRAVVFPDGQFP